MRSFLLIFSLLLTGALGIVPVSAGGARAVSVVSPVSIGSPIAMLGGLIEASAPGLSESKLVVPLWTGDGYKWVPSDGTGLGSRLQVDGKAVPTALDSRKAAVLAARAREIEKGQVQAAARLGSVAQAAREDPAKVIERVNAVLQDFTPEKLRSMPAERLHAVSAVIMDPLGAGYRADRREMTRGIVTLSKARTEAIMANRGKPLDVDQPYKQVRDMQTVPVYVKGTPDTLRVIRPVSEPDAKNGAALSKPGAVFRHYTTEEGLRSILKSRSLWNGNLEYIELIVYVSRTFYRDLTGLFVTLPDVSGTDVGVPADYRHYVDIHLPSGYPLIMPDPRYEGILLVPLPRRTQGWVKEFYRKWLKKEQMTDRDKDMAKGLDDEGGPGPDLDIPVKIIGHGVIKGR